MGPPLTRPAVWVRRFILLAAALVFAGVIYVGHTALFGIKLGKTCLVSSDCKWGGTGRRLCLQQHWGYCTRPCQNSQQCPDSWTCDLEARPRPACRKPRQD
jgi:hypothetical protein